MGTSMKHVILGAGNLGKDLLLELNKIPGACPEILSQSRGTSFSEYKNLFAEIKSRAPSVLWVPVGGGSVQESKAPSVYRQKSLYLNEHLPIALNEDVPTACRIVFFSTDYAANETEPGNPLLQSENPRSEYAKQKIRMEKTILEANKPNRAIVRVTSLYGIHKPEKTFPGKILRNFTNRFDKIVLPVNRVTPTPTRWLASVLSQNLNALLCEKKTLIHHCAPNGNVTVAEWGRLVLDGVRDLRDVARDDCRIDEERPPFSALGCSFTAVHHWYELWNIYFKREHYMKKSQVPAGESLKAVDLSVELQGSSQ
jgi:hypothetical protein